MRILLFVFCVIPLMGVWAQPPDVSCSPGDRRAFERLMGGLEEARGLPVGQAVVLAGKAFLGTPYRANTLEVSDLEPLVVNFSGLDCTTFVENALVIGRLLNLGSAEWEAYLGGLEKVRYRRGERAGYPSRLHYFSEWIRDNSSKGFITDITPELGGVLVSKEINFMGAHRESYPLLASEQTFAQIRQMERDIRGISLCVLPKNEVADRESDLRDGDIIALATDIPGLDVTHTGIALRQRDGRVYLLHASTQGQVMITEEPLTAYLDRVRGNTGIIVARPLMPSP